MATLERPRPSAVEQFTHPRPPRSRRRRVLAGIGIGVVIVLCALAIPVSLGAFGWLYNRPLPDDAAFAIGTDVTTVADYDERLKSIKALFGAQEPADPAGKDRFRRDVAKAMAVANVMRAAEPEFNIVIPDRKVRDTLTAGVTQKYGPGPDGYKKFTDSLAQVGSSEARMLDEIRAQLGTTELVNAVTKDTTATDEEVRAAYPKYAAELGVPETRKLSNIVVTTPEQGNDLLAQIRSGVPFADLARKFSLDEATKGAGGDIGQPMPKQGLQQPFADAAFAAPKGQPFGPVRSEQGWNVGLVVDVVPGKPATFEEAQIPLENVVNSDKKLEVWRDWLGQRLTDAHIRYADAYRPADPTGVPADLGPQG